MSINKMRCTNYSYLGNYIHHATISQDSALHDIHRGPLVVVLGLFCRWRLVTLSRLVVLLVEQVLHTIDVHRFLDGIN